MGSIKRYQNEDDMRNQVEISAVISSDWVWFLSLFNSLTWLYLHANSPYLTSVVDVAKRFGHDRIAWFFCSLIFDQCCFIFWEALLSKRLEKAPISLFLKIFLLGTLKINNWINQKVIIWQITTFFKLYLHNILYSHVDLSPLMLH